VIGAGVIADGNIFEISAWVIPLIRYGDPGILTREVNPMTRSDVIRRRKCINEKLFFVTNELCHYKCKVNDNYRS
jgi:hypothetical protein